MSRADTIPEAPWPTSDRDDRPVRRETTIPMFKPARTATAHDTVPSDPSSRTTEPSATTQEATIPSAPESADELAAELEHFAGRAPQHAKHQAESAGLSAAKYDGQARPARSRLPAASEGAGIVVTITEPLPGAPSARAEPEGAEPTATPSQPEHVGPPPPKDEPPQADPASTPRHEGETANRFVSTVPRYDLRQRRQRRGRVAVVGTILALALVLAIVAIVRETTQAPGVSGPTSVAPPPSPSGTTEMASPIERASATSEPAPTAAPPTTPEGASAGTPGERSPEPPSRAPVAATGESTGGATLSPPATTTSARRILPPAPRSSSAPAASPPATVVHPPPTPSSPSPAPSHDHVRSI